MKEFSPQLMQFAETLRSIIDDKKGERITVLDVSQQCGYADVLVIASGNSARQVQAIGDAIAQHAGRKPYSMEGYQRGEWLLIDFGDVVVHLLQPEFRARYNLEELWTEGGIAESAMTATTPTRNESAVDRRERLLRSFNARSPKVRRQTLPRRRQP